MIADLFVCVLASLFICISVCLHACKHIVFYSLFAWLQPVSLQACLFICLLAGGIFSLFGCLFAGGVFRLFGCLFAYIVA